MNRNFSQMITVRCSDPQLLCDMLAEWDLAQATTDIMGYMGTRVLADREQMGRYVIIADFGVIDPNVSAADEAARNNARPETRAFSARMREILELGSLRERAVADPIVVLDAVDQIVQPVITGVRPLDVDELGLLLGQEVLVLEP